MATTMFWIVRKSSFFCSSVSRLSAPRTSSPRTAVSSTSLSPSPGARPSWLPLGRAVRPALAAATSCDESSLPPARGAGRRGASRPPVSRRGPSPTSGGRCVSDAPARHSACASDRAPGPECSRCCARAPRSRAQWGSRPLRSRPTLLLFSTSIILIIIATQNLKSTHAISESEPPPFLRLFKIFERVRE